MEIRFNVTGTDRKKLAGTVSRIVGCVPVYKGAPTFAYAIADFLIDKDGTLSGAVTTEMLDALALQGFPSESADEGADAPTVAEQQPGIENWSEPATPENAPDSPGVPSDDVIAYLPGQVDHGDALTIELPKDGFTDATIANLEKLIESKAALIKKSLGVDALPVEQTETAVRFPWFVPGLSAEELDAYAHFIAALCKMAKEQVRINAKPKEVENEKYAFRCFLLRLGFKGKELGPARKVLLRRLSGNGSFKSSERRPTVLAAVAPDGAHTEVTGHE